MSASPITVTDTMLDALRRTKPWVTFLSILGFVFTGLLALLALMMFATGGIWSAVPRQPGAPAFLGPAFGVGLGILYLVVAVFMYLLPCVILFRYGTAIGRIASGDAEEAMEQALSKQKSFWKYVGILAIVFLVLYVLLIIGGIIAAVTLGMHAVH
ncbi:MAG: hypothetical protein KGL98_09205 [Gammaproteobacteria bacterium]|nr:hypothetical protein [Gammaproteobacteria bacterium]MBU6509614.1 hypothetical protein [Gammaproteobacteria bacterium]MDE1983730.1 hypothetical protein [Gammaproteobacteria bacterium]MDE2109039.1 hypothetical protein [Gammaproteobacteria bacterium]MDE2461412.1 hypothetical protein [Gammaproteobacteria bacterium]